MFPIKPLSLLLVVFAATAAIAQADRGELRVRSFDATGAGVPSRVHLVSEGNGYDKLLSTDGVGPVRIPDIPTGRYLLTVSAPGFAPFTETVQISSPVPFLADVTLRPATVISEVKVTAEGTILDPRQTTSVMQIGTQEIEQRLTALPGRSVQDLVVSQPGWLYEGNAVLHPRGSEYQTQMAIDGIPLTDNRSPSFGPEIEADDLDSVTIYTAGFPAEFGRKMGGVVELDTKRQTGDGLHGETVFYGGSYDTAGGYARVQQVAGKNTFGGSASGSMTDHYLNPVVPENFTNRGTTADFSLRFDRDMTPNDRIALTVRHELSRFLIPNELVQQQAGQVQNGDNFETMGTASYQHIISQASLLAFSGMARDNANDLYSNVHPDPIAAFQHNDFREGYLKATYSLFHGNHEIKAGVESDSIFLHENFHYLITDPTQFDPDTPASLAFVAQRPDLEQGAFVEDTYHSGEWTLSAGLRWDHYQLLLNQNAWSPRLSAARYFGRSHTLLHASYDRIFQTPSFENILISSSPQIDALSSQFLRLPVQPSRGNYYETGVTQEFGHCLGLYMNMYRRDVRNYADDDQLLNTGISYPIAFDHAVIYGAEAKLNLVQLGRLSGFTSYSYMVGNVWFPVTGGLFLGDDAGAAATQLSGHFPDSQDQRNTLRTRFRYQLLSRAWVGAGASFGSGLPFDYDGDEATALAEYGPAVISRINFARGRIRPLLAVDSSLNIDLYHREKQGLQLQIDGDNLNNRLNLIDFGGLFSGNAIAPGRTVMARLTASF